MLKHLFFQLAFTVGVIVVFGLLIALCRRTFLKNTGYTGYRILLVTGAVGTPVHELSHALMCIIFGHKVVEMKLYQPNNEDGTLGYVNHAYDPKNLYHIIGNFFIGIAPILGGSGVLLLLMSWLVPDVHTAFSVAASGVDVTNFWGYFGLFGRVLGAVFSPVNFISIRWWIFMILALMVASHMELSTADLKGSYGGLITLAVLFLVIDIILYMFAPEALDGFTASIMSFSGYIVSFLVISAVFSLLLLAFTPLVRSIEEKRLENE